MSKVILTCPHCQAHLTLRDNGYADPSTTDWCPFCGSTGLRSLPAPVTSRRPKPRKAA
jgi:hypothetical protein